MWCRYDVFRKRNLNKLIILHSFSLWRCIHIKYWKVLTGHSMLLLVSMERVLLCLIIETLHNLNHLYCRLELVRVSVPLKCSQMIDAKYLQVLFSGIFVIFINLKFKLYLRFVLVFLVHCIALDYTEGYTVLFLRRCQTRYKFALSRVTINSRNT